MIARCEVNAYERWVPEIVGLFGDVLEGIVLFGSAARGERGTDSDIDILVVLAPETPIKRDLYRTWDAADLGRLCADAEVSPQFVELSHPKDAGSLWFEVALDGIVLWDRQGRVAELLRDLRSRIARGILRRQTVYGQPYWLRDDHAES